MSYDSVNTKQVKVEFHYMSVERKKAVKRLNYL